MLNKLKEQLIKIKNCYITKAAATIALWLIEAVLLCATVIIGFCTGAWAPIIILIIIILALIYKDALAKIIPRIEKIKFASWLEVSLRNVSEIEILLKDAMDLIKQEKISDANELLKSVENKTKEMRVNMEQQSSKSISNESIVASGDNANGTYYRYSNGVQIISKSVRGPVDKSATFTFPAVFSKPPFFVQFIGIEQPIVKANNSYITAIFKTSVKEDAVFTINALGLWK